eukprot:498669-Pleurochrysis_carterae.AAC.1
MPYCLLVRGQPVWRRRAGAERRPTKTFHRRSSTRLNKGVRTSQGACQSASCSRALCLEGAPSSNNT